MLLCGVEGTFRNVQRSRIPGAEGRKVARRCRKAMCQPDDTGLTYRRCAPNLPVLPYRTSNHYFMRRAAPEGGSKGDYMRVNLLDFPKELCDELWDIKDPVWFSDGLDGTYYLRNGSSLLSSERPDAPYQEFHFPRPARWIVVQDSVWQQFLDKHYGGVCPEEVLLVPGNGPLLDSVMLILTGNFPRL